jgi:hypothetical protein
MVTFWVRQRNRLVRAIPPIHKLAIIGQRERMEKTGVVDGQSVRDWDLELRELFFGIAEAVVNPPMPQLMNTDNEPMEPRTLHYELDSPQAAFDALKDLDTNATEEEILDETTRDANGQVEKALLHWVKPGNSAHTSKSRSLDFGAFACAAGIGGLIRSHNQYVFYTILSIKSIYYCQSNNVLAR